MDYAKLTSRRFSNMRYNSPLERSLKRSTYIPNKRIIKDVKNILKKYLNLDKSPKSNLHEKTGVFQNSDYTVSFSTPTQSRNQDLTKRSKGIRRFCKTPNFIRKKSAPKKNKIDQSARPGLYRKVFSADPSKRQNRSENRFINSNYSSYSDIYHGLVEKIPLVF